jgi:hypothetical protein
MARDMLQSVWKKLNCCWYVYRVTMGTLIKVDKLEVRPHIVWYDTTASSYTFIHENCQVGFHPSCSLLNEPLWTIHLASEVRVTGKNELARCGRRQSWPNLTYDRSVYMERLKKTTTVFSQGGWFSCQQPSPLRQLSRLSRTMIFRGLGRGGSNFFLRGNRLRRE